MSRGERVVLAGLVALSLALGCVNLGKPFLHHNESSCTQVGKLARNFLKFGPAATRLGVMDVSGPSLDAYENPRAYYYASHPPLTYWLATVPLALVGGEAGVRLLPAAFMTGGVVLIFLIGRRLLGSPWSGVAGAVYAVCPMIAYNSIATVHLPVVLFFVLLGLWAYLRWLESEHLRDFAVLLAAQGLACAADWQGYYLAPALALHLALVRRDRWRRGIVLVALNVVHFALYVGFLYLLDPGHGNALAHLFGAGKERIGLAAAQLPRFLAGELREIGLYFTVPVALLAAWGAGATRHRFLLALLVLGLDEVLFMPYAHAHDYFTYALAPFFSLAAAAGGRELLLRTPRPRLRTAALGLAALAFLAQSAWVLHNRWTRSGGYDFYYRLAGAIDAVAAPDDHVLILTDDIRFYTPYYADRRATWYDAGSGRLLEENSGPRVPIPPDALLRLLNDSEARFHWAVTADRDGIRRHVPFLAQASDGLLRRFGVHPDFDLVLQARDPAPVERDGFRLWRLRR